MWKIDGRIEFNSTSRLKALGPRKAYFRRDGTRSLGRRNTLRSLIAIVFCCLFLCSGSALYGLSPSTSISQYGHTVWRLGQNGLNSIPLAIAQTADGYIWIGTSYGLYRFDGVRFTHWTPPNGEQLHSSFIFRLLGAHDGSLYIGTDRGLSRLTDGHIYNYPEAILWPGPFVEDGQGNVWMGEFGDFTPSSTLCKIGTEHLSCVGTKDGFGCRNGTVVMSERPGSVWVGSKQGICRWQEGAKPENYLLPYLSKPNMGNNWVDALAADGQGVLWAGIPITGPGYGLLSFSSGRWKNYVSSEVDGSKLPVTSLLVDHSDSLWVGTRGKGIFRLNDKKLDRFDTADGLSGNSINATFEDHEGDLWVITDRGLDEFRDLPVITFTSRQGLPVDQAVAIAATDDGTMWVGTKSSLAQFRDHRSSVITLERGLPTSEVHYLFHDSQNRLWMAGGDKLFLYKNHQFLPVTGGNGDKIGYVGYITEDSSHRLWVSILNEETGKSYILLIAALHVAKQYDSTQPMEAQGINALAPDSEGGLWVGGFKHGFFHFQDGTFRRVIPGTFNDPVIEMTTDPDGTVWIVTEEKGILRYKDGNAHFLTSKKRTSM